MNPVVYCLLKGYLIRSVWPYAVLGLAQFLLVEDFWLRDYGRMPVAGMALGMWGAAAALNANSLVWRSLPILAKDASVFRWWTIAGAPGIFLTLLIGIAWASQRSSGFPTPAPDVILEGVFAIWAVLGPGIRGQALALAGRGEPQFRTRQGRQCRTVRLPIRYLDGIATDLAAHGYRRRNCDCTSGAVA